jgi:uncharacterized membrane protein (UPF0127 family)
VPAGAGSGAREIGGAAGGPGVVRVVNEERDSRPRRFRRQPRVEVRGRSVPVALSRRARLLGLALLDRRTAGAGLLLPGCRSVHTFGMRFPLDLFFLDFELREVSLRRAVPPGRVAFERRAQAVLELPASEPGRHGGT